MKTQEYRTRTIYKSSDNKNVLQNGMWPIGLDIGYSSVKTYSGNAYACIPSYAAQSQSSMYISVGGLSTNNASIAYQDESGMTWNVGAPAQNAISVSDTSAGSMAIFGRSRYYDPMFKVLARVGIAAALIKNQYGNPEGKHIFIETGLPPQYVASDTEDLMAILLGEHDYYVKFFGGENQHFHFVLGKDDINIMAQPEGTLYSILTDKNMLLTPQAKAIYEGKTLINDPGFGTNDVFPIVNGHVQTFDYQTFTDLGMKQVLIDTTQEIKDRYNFEISVPAFQKYLETGQVLKKNGRTYAKVEFADILEKHSNDICDRSLSKIINIYNPAVEYDNYVLTGGTGAAWSNRIRNSDLFTSDTIQFIPGNMGDPSLPYILSNARGYYIYALSNCVHR